MEIEQAYSPKVILLVAKNCSRLRSFDLAMMVRRRTSPIYQETPLTDDHIKAFVEYLPNLQSFHLKVSSVGDALTGDTFRLLGTHLRELKTLELTIRTRIRFQDIVPHDQVLFPKLRKLSLFSFNTSEAEEDVAETFFRHAPSLQSLWGPHLTNLGHGWSKSGATIYWMLQKCREGVAPEQRTLEEFREF